MRNIQRRGHRRRGVLEPTLAGETASDLETRCSEDAPGELELGIGSVTPLLSRITAAFNVCRARKPGHVWTVFLSIDHKYRKL